MTAMRALIALLLTVCLASTAGAEGRPGRLTYTAYVAGLRVFELEVGLDVSRDRYRVDLDYRTAGVFGALFSGELRSVSQGRFVADRAVPLHLSVEGKWRGKQRASDIDWVDGAPVIHVLEPPNEEERESVPAALQANTVDSIASVITLLRQLQDGAGCTGSARVYDGRRLSVISASNAGEETLEASGRSGFRGIATRCDFEGKLLAGFMLDDDRTRAARPQIGSAWLATLLPNAPPVPVRLVFETRWFGHVTMYLTSATPGPTPG
jgi:hypothetical protein